MNELHIYTAEKQPATNFTDGHSGEPMHFTRKPKSLMRCHACNLLRRAENCAVQVYYDHLGQWCAPGKGCKSEAWAEAKRRREFRNRSRGQKRRHQNRMVTDLPK